MGFSLPIIIQFVYLAAAALFILGLHNLNSPATARRGNLMAAVGMFIAIAATLLHQEVLDYGTLIAGMVLGASIGAVAARVVKLTAMPQMVGLFNGFGGGASALVAIAEFWRLQTASSLVSGDTLCTILWGLFIGGLTLSGSLAAFGKLQGWLPGRPVLYPFQRSLNVLFLALYLAGSVYLMHGVLDPAVFVALIALSLLLGVLFVMPIGGADMPVVVSLLNSLSGLAAASAGFILENNILIISGALVGAAGAILTRIMSKAMNRALFSILFGTFGADAEDAAAGGPRTARSIDPEQAAMMLAYSGTVVIIPGYGMAVARAQQAVRDLADQLEKRGVQVKYAIHPVAGRMPGHMNVLLAEAEVPYEKLYDLEDINPEFERTDVALVIGASDVVNPAARHAKGSPIYGMPILNADKARNIIVVKRGMSPGFSGIENELFYHERTVMLFGDAREAVQGLANEVKQL